MYLQPSDTLQLGDQIQQQLVVHMARYDKVMSFAAKSLTLEHFPWNPGAVIVKVLFDYYGQYKRRPPFQILATEVKTLLGTSGQVYIQEAEVQALVQTLTLIKDEPEAGLDEEWALKAAKRYLAQFRLADFAKSASIALQTGVGVEAAVQQASELSQGLETASSGPRVAFCMDTSDFNQSGEAKPRITTGLDKMDAAIGGGLAEKETCLVAALQGVGKTNLMLNFMMSAAYDGWYSLIFSLEMPSRSLRERFVPMSAVIPAIRLRETGLARFTDYERRRIEMASQSEINKRNVIADYTGISCTLDEIVAFTGKWLALLESRGIRDKAGLVCIDYINLISVANLGRDKTELSPDVVKQTVDGITQKIAKAYGLRVYLATQTTSAAEGNQVLSRKHIAWGFHANDAVDFGFGLARKEDTRYDQLAAGASSDFNTKGQKLILSSFKARVGNEVAFEFYQAPTLRMYNDARDYNTLLSSIQAGEFDPNKRG